MKTHVKSVSTEYHERLRKALRIRARDLLRKYAPVGPPYDPYLVARGLGVDVQDTEIAGIEGFIETRNGRYVASISTGANETRRRFTLAHELCHVLLMRTAEDGKPVNLIRFRANGNLPGLHQDPVEESLCNYFAGELLMPSDEICKRLMGQKVVPATILDFARDYDVSQQAAAIQIVKVLRDRLIACSFWNLQSLWPMPLWWTGLRTQYQSELRCLEGLVERSSEIIEVWESYGGRRQRVTVMVTPTPAKRYALILVAKR
jgi:IrrE N-terminal-like domain